ncbi:MAG: hypothetical protein KKE71_04870, partial [Nanoarchaeota archaeon]|nr:hypothetical protein [Nanoarchaeota archaeon]
MQKKKQGGISLEIRKIALLNAVSFGGKANAKAVAGKVLASIPSARENIPETTALAEKICFEVSSMSIDAQNAELSKLKITVPEKKAKEEKKALPPLAGA